MATIRSSIAAPGGGSGSGGMAAKTRASSAVSQASRPENAPPPVPGTERARPSCRKRRLEHIRREGVSKTRGNLSARQGAICAMKASSSVLGIS